MPLYFLDLFEFLGRSLAGWRFLGSRSYRERTRARWSQQRQMETMQEVIGAVIGMVITGVLPLLLVVSLLVEGR